MRLSCVTLSGSSSDVKDILFSIHLPITASLSLSLSLSSCILHRMVQFGSEWRLEYFQPVLPGLTFRSRDTCPGLLVRSIIFSLCFLFCQSTLGRPWTCLLQWAASSCHSPCLNPQDALDSSMVIIPPVSSQPPLLTTLEQLSDNPFVM